MKALKKLEYLLFVPYVFLMDLLFHLAYEYNEKMMGTVFLVGLALLSGVNLLINRNFLKASEKTAIISLLATALFWIDTIIFAITDNVLDLIPFFWDDIDIEGVLIVIYFIVSPVFHMLIFFIAKSVDNHKKSEKQSPKSQNNRFIFLKISAFLPYLFALDFFVNTYDSWYMIFNFDDWFIPLSGLFIAAVFVAVFSLIFHNFKKAIFWGIINNVCSFFFILIYCQFFEDAAPIFSSHKTSDYAAVVLIIVFINLAILLITGVTCLFLAKFNSKQRR